MASLSYTTELHLDMEAFTIETTDYYENFNQVYRIFMGNDAALNQRMNDIGLCVNEDGKLCLEMEDQNE